MNTKKAKNSWDIRKLCLYFLFLCLLFLRSSVSYLIITSFPKLGVSFNLNNFQLGSVVSVFYLMSAIFIFIWIYLFGRYSKIRLFLLSSFIWALGSIFFAFSQNYPSLLLTSGIIGIGIESSSVIILIFLLLMSPKEKQGKVLTLYILIQGAGSIFGVFITANFEDILGLSWNYVFLVIGTISLIGVLIAALIFSRFKKVSDVIAPLLDKIGYNLSFKSFRRIIGKRTNKNLLIQLLYVFPIIAFFNLWIQKYFQDYHSLTQMEAAISFIFLTGGEFLGMIVGSFLYDKFYTTKNYKKIYIPMLSILVSIPLFYFGFWINWRWNSNNIDSNLVDVSLGLLDFALANNYAFICYSLLFFGFFAFAFTYPFQLIVINDCNTENDKSTMIAMRNLLELVGLAISPIMGGLIADNFSILIVMIFIPIFLIVPVVHLFFMKKIIEKDFILINKERNYESNIEM